MNINNEKMSVYSNYDDLVEAIHNSGREYDMATIERAYLTAHKAHDGQKRKSGEPYIVHPVSVARMLVELGMDTDCIVTALLHDTVEDTDMELSDLERDFGKTIAELVDGVTKLRKLNYSTREEHQAENLRKMLIAMNRDIRVIIVKLADRLNNMRTLSAMTEQKQRDIAKETMDVYAPIADRLGIRAVKEELEDLSLRFLDKVGYNAITEMLSGQQADREAFLASIKNEIADRIRQDLPDAQIEARIKSVHGIYRKVYVQGKDFSDIYDIYAIRIIVKTLAECYHALGIIHEMYIPLPNRFKDYITMPKQNGYQSLHTTVMRRETEETDDGEEKPPVPFEVQIRTVEMHMTAEYGIAAHWKYKIGDSSLDSLDDRIAWIRKVLEGESEEITDLVDQIKETAEVFVFTPRGDVKRLPAGATVIDFAYSIHSQVGHRMTGAKVNGRMVPFNYEVHTGDIVEIQTTKEITTGPKRDWLKIVRTGEAKSKIRSWFKNERREDNITSGREEFARELRRSSIRLTEKNTDDFYNGVMNMVHMNSMDDVYAAIGYGGLSLVKLMPRVRDLYAKLVKTEESANIEEKPPVIEPPAHEPSHAGGVIIEGVEDCQYKMSKCCNPLPGDEIIGFITRGFGVSIHKRDCSNIPRDIEHCAEPERYVHAHWADKIAAGQEYKATLKIYCLNRKGLLADITSQLSNMHIGIHLLNSRETKDDHAVITLTITVNDAGHLEFIINRLSRIQNVIKIERP